MNLDQFKGAWQGMDQETRATQQTQVKTWNRCGRCGRNVFV